MEDLGVIASKIRSLRTTVVECNLRVSDPHVCEWFIIDQVARV